MKVLFISEYFPPQSRGGGEISSYLLAKELANTINIHVLTSHFPGLKKRKTKENITYHRLLKTGNDPTKIKDNIQRILNFEKSLLNELIKLDKKENYDLIHCFNISSIPAVKLKNKLNKKFIMHVNSPVPFCPKGTLMYKDKYVCDKKCNTKTFIDCVMNSKQTGKLSSFGLLINMVGRHRFNQYQKLIKNFNHYMPISNFMKKRLTMNKIDETKISVVYNINDFDNFLKLKTPNNKIPKILYLGEYSAPKGPQIILEALKDVKGYEANFYGSGVLKKQLIETVIKDNLNVSSFDTGFPIDFKKLREELGDEVEISGGPSVEILLNGNPDKVYQTTRDILTSGIMKGKRFVLREGNNLPPNVPAENLESMYTAALRFGRYRD